MLPEASSGSMLNRVQVAAVPGWMLRVATGVTRSLVANASIRKVGPPTVSLRYQPLTPTVGAVPDVLRNSIVWYATPPLTWRRLLVPSLTSLVPPTASER